MRSRVQSLGFTVSGWEFRVSRIRPPDGKNTGKCEVTSLGRETCQKDCRVWNLEFRVWYCFGLGFRASSFGVPSLTQEIWTEGINQGRCQKQTACQEIALPGFLVGSKGFRVSGLGFRV